MERTECAVWIGYLPNFGEGSAPVDVAHEACMLLDRDAGDPAHFDADGVFWYDPTGASQLRRFRRAAREHAALLRAEDITRSPEPKWRSSEAAASTFAETVGSDFVSEDRYVSVSGKTLARVSGAIYRSVLVGDGEFEFWRTNEKKGGLEDRLNPEERGNVALYVLQHSLEVAGRTWPMLGGPRAALEFLARSGNFVSFNAEWVRLSSASRRNPWMPSARSGDLAVFSSQHDLEILRPSLRTNNLRVSRLSRLEQDSRHALRTDKAAARTPGPPDLSDRSVLTGGMGTSKGAPASSSFAAWIPEKQKEKGMALALEGLYRDNVTRTAMAQNSRAKRGEEPLSRACRKAKPSA